MSEGLIVVIGSGELGASMKTTYRHFLEHVDASSITIVDTPYGFQENADDLTARIQQHFRDAFGLKTHVASLRRATRDEKANERFSSTVAEAEVVFAGPGSPSYAINAWRGTGLTEALINVIDRGGAVVMASAAAVAIGTKSIPVYEIYKVGADPVWIDGIDLLSAYGLKVAIVPHWNNREGGSHDTSHCFIGSRRFRALQAELPADVSVLGVDEHTSLTLHTANGMMTVLGAGEAHINDSDFAGTLAAPSFVDRPTLPKLEKSPEAQHPWQPIVDLLIELRSQARAKGDFAESDLIRDRLRQVGVELRDSADGTESSVESYLPNGQARSESDSPFRAL
jgi:cyanophycinase-like exopeptidase